ncbi:MAG: hypothetical protein QM726_20245 [Chitinophagaceae bacterium]
MMTAEQYCFPYFFDLIQFNLLLQSFGLQASIVNDTATQMPEQLLIKNEEAKALITIPFGACVMLEEDNLYYWETDTDIIDIQQVLLRGLASDPWILNTRLNLSNFKEGKNNFNNHLDCACFVSFTRKSSISYKQEEFENFAIVVLTKDAINIIPFHSFNQSNNALAYTWPVIAKLDLDSKMLYGKGMRMQDFNIDLGWAL